jgi:hypothetical protein
VRRVGGRDARGVGRMGVAVLILTTFYWLDGDEQERVQSGCSIWCCWDFNDWLENINRGEEKGHQ